MILITVEEVTIYASARQESIKVHVLTSLHILDFIDYYARRTTNFFRDPRGNIAARCFNILNVIDVSYPAPSQVRAMSSVYFEGYVLGPDRKEVPFSQWE